LGIDFIDFEAIKVIGYGGCREGEISEINAIAIMSEDGNRGIIEREFE
jgi:hypothetical protein